MHKLRNIYVRNQNIIMKFSAAQNKVFSIVIFNIIHALLT